MIELLSTMRPFRLGLGRVEQVLSRTLAPQGWLLTRPINSA